MKRGLGAAWTIGLVFVLICCSRSEKEPTPDVARDFEYHLTGLRYFMATGDKIDTVSIDLGAISLYNPASATAQQTIESSAFEGLRKTSAFEIDNEGSLPEGVVPEQFKVSVPGNWSGGDTFGFFPEKFPLTTETVEKPYPEAGKQFLDVTLPPKATVLVERKIDAYQLRCSFTAEIVNTTTGELYPVSGKWAGVLRYNNASVVVTEQ